MTDSFCLANEYTLFSCRGHIYKLFWGSLKMCEKKRHQLWPAINLIWHCLRNNTSYAIKVFWGPQIMCVCLRNDTKYSPNASLMLVHRLRRWTNIKLTLGQVSCLLGRWCFAGLTLWCRVFIYRSLWWPRTWSARLTWESYGGSCRKTWNASVSLKVRYDCCSPFSPSFAHYLGNLAWQLEHNV